MPTKSGMNSRLSPRPSGDPGGLFNLGRRVMEIEEIKRRQAAYDLIYKTAIDIRKMIDFAMSEVDHVLQDDDAEDRIRELVFE